MAASFDYTKVNLYDILDIPPDASEKDVIKAYRKKALKYHPDKNPDPSAVDIFHKLSKALEVLTDAAAKAAYDQILKARAAAELRNKKLDAKRQKLKQDLEERERAGLSEEQKRAQQARNLQAEIDRLRKEGSSLLEREQALLREELAKQTNQQQTTTEAEEPIRIKLKWKCSKTDSQNGGYNQEVIRDLFRKYGQVETILISSKKNGTAVLEFGASSPQLISAGLERGLDQCPLSVTWLSGKPSDVFDTPSSNIGTQATSVEERGGDSSENLPHKPCTLTSDMDFENLVLMKMRQAEERKRIIAQMKLEDEAANENPT